MGDLCGVLRRARPAKARSTRKEKGILWGAQRIYREKSTLSERDREPVRSRLLRPPASEPRTTAGPRGASTSRTMAPSLPKPHAIYIQQQRVKNGFTGNKGNVPAASNPPATEPKNPAPPKP
eukprot:scaffold11925_cov101-Isochrysis_galbana.AAC.5